MQGTGALVCDLATERMNSIIFFCASSVAAGVYPSAMQPQPSSSTAPSSADASAQRAAPALFTRRKQPTKRRVRKTTAALADEAPLTKSGNDQVASTLSDGTAASSVAANRLSLPARRRPPTRRRLRAPPTVAGYDAEPSGEDVEDVPSYSDAALTALRIDTAKTAPMQSDAPTALRTSAPDNEPPPPRQPTSGAIRVLEDDPPAHSTAEQAHRPTPTPVAPDIMMTDNDPHADCTTAKPHHSSSASVEPDIMEIDDDPSHSPSSRTDGRAPSPSQHMPLPAASRTADPFSNAWGHDEIPRPVIDDRADVDSASADSDDAEAAADWESALVRRAGVQPVRDAARAGRERAAVRDHVVHSDRKPPRLRSLNGSKAGLNNRGEGSDSAEDLDIDDGVTSNLSSWRASADAELIATQESVNHAQRILYEAEMESKSAAIAEHDATGPFRLYERLAADVADLSTALRDARPRLKAAREVRLQILRARAAHVKETRKAGTDEFGRARRPGAPVSVVEEDEQMDDKMEKGTCVVTEAPAKLRDVNGVIWAFSKWREEDPEGYSQAFADVGLGRLVGALATGMDSLQWTAVLTTEQLRAAMRVCDVVEESEAFVGAFWQPREVSSCEEVGLVVGAIARAANDEERGKIEDAVYERWDLETEMGRQSEDGSFVRQCVIGGLRLCRFANYDFSVLAQLQDAQRFGITDAANVQDVRNLLMWVCEGRRDTNSNRLPQDEQRIKLGINEIGSHGGDGIAHVAHVVSEEGRTLARRLITEMDGVHFSAAQFV